MKSNPFQISVLVSLTMLCSQYHPPEREFRKREEFQKLQSVATLVNKSSTVATGVSWVDLNGFRADVSIIAESANFEILLTYAQTPSDPKRRNKFDRSRTMFSKKATKVELISIMDKLLPLANALDLAYARPSGNALAKQGITSVQYILQVTEVRNGGPKVSCYCPEIGKYKRYDDWPTANWATTAPSEFKTFMDSLQAIVVDLTQTWTTKEEDGAITYRDKNGKVIKVL